MGSRSATLSDAFILFLLTWSAKALVGPSDLSLRISGHKRGVEIPAPCLQNCTCSSSAIRCDHIIFSEDIRNEFNFDKISITNLKNTYLNGTDILSGLNSNLRWLRLSNGQLLSYPSLPFLPSLISLDLSDNALKSLSAVQLKNTPHIVHLNLSGNSLVNISSNALHNLTDLKELDLSRNPLLKQLSDNFFDHLELRYLDLSDTGLSVYSESWSKFLQNVIFLNLSKNSIKYLPPITSLQNLRVLDLSHNPLLELPRLAGFPYLTTLFVSHTIISYLRVSETKGCHRLTVLDLSHSNLRNVNYGVLGHCKHLRELNVNHNLHLWKVEYGAVSGLSNLAILKLNNCPKLYDMPEDALDGLDNLRELHLQNSGIRVLPHYLSQMNLTYLNLEDTSLLCDCHAYWLPEFLANSKNNWKGVDTIQCNDGVKRTPQDLNNHLEETECSPVESNTPANKWTLTPWGQSAMLECNVSGNPTPKVIWQTVDQRLHVFKQIKETPWVHHLITEALSVAEIKSDGKYQVLQSGQLLIKNITRRDIGRYKCFAYNPVSNSSVVQFLGIDDSAFRALFMESIFFGFSCAALFLLITLVVQLINYIMNRMEWECCCCKNRLSPKAKQIRQLIESVESYKKAQLDKLKDNYNSQVVSIKDSCYQQMERLRESYAQQSKNLKDLCDYSTQQFTGARDQYLDQVNKVRDYSMSQMNRVRENYVFQRHRIRKFSGHQLLRLRETYKYQQKTLNKLLETLPDLYIQNCRTGSCQRTDSIIFEDEIVGLDVYYKVDFLDAQSLSSDYYTPNSTLTRYSKGAKHSHSRNPSSTSAGTEYQEARSNLTRQESAGSDKGPDYKATANQRFHNRSFSISTPPAGIHRIVESHKRSISASSHPSPQAFHPKPPLLEESGGETVFLPSKTYTIKSTPPSPIISKYADTEVKYKSITPMHPIVASKSTPNSPLHTTTLLSATATSFNTPISLTPVHAARPSFDATCKDNGRQTTDGKDLISEVRSDTENCDNVVKEFLQNSDSEMKESETNEKSSSARKASYETSL